MQGIKALSDGRLDGNDGGRRQHLTDENGRLDPGDRAAGEALAKA
jgi:hypothetical protein